MYIKDYSTKPNIWEDISTDECMKITSSDTDVEMITPEESTVDSGFL